MASISDVFDALNDIKGKLDVLHADNVGNGNKLDILAGKLDTISQAQQFTNQLLQQTTQQIHHLSKQEITIICVLENISRNTCDLVNLSSAQLTAARAMQEQTRVSAEILLAMNPQAALDLQHRDKLKREIERCCPPEAQGDRCGYKPCEDPGSFGDHPIE